MKVLTQIFHLNFSIGLSGLSFRVQSLGWSQAAWTPRRPGFSGLYFNFPGRRSVQATCSHKHGGSQARRLTLPLQEGWYSFFVGFGDPDLHSSSPQRSKVIRMLRCLGFYGSFSISLDDGASRLPATCAVLQ